MTFKVTSPQKGLNLKTVYGSTTLIFVEGVAEVEDLSEGVQSYLKDKGYKVVKGRKTGDAEPDKVEAAVKPKSDAAEGTERPPLGEEKAK